MITDDVSVKELCRALGALAAEYTALARCLDRDESAELAREAAQLRLVRDLVADGAPDFGTAAGYVWLRAGQSRLGAFGSGRDAQ